MQYPKSGKTSWFAQYIARERPGFIIKFVKLATGFTLIELLVVIAIIAILATLVLTQIQSAQIRAKNTSAVSDITEAGKTVETWKVLNTSDVVVIRNSNTTAGAVPAANVVNRTVTSWPFTGTEASGTNGTYGTSISKTPSPSYTYGYQTNASGSSYCIGTNGVTGAGVTTALGLVINNGASKSSLTSTPNYGGASHVPVLPCT